MIKWLKAQYSKLLDLYYQYKLEKLIDKELYIGRYAMEYPHYEDETQRKYAEGLFEVKRKINSLVNAKTKEEYNKVLLEVKEIIPLAREETKEQKAIRKALERVYVRYGADVKSEADKSRMILERIHHFEELRVYKEERVLISKIKAAKKLGQEDIAKTLEKEWKEKYHGKARNS
jgi:hypothetical protein